MASITFTVPDPMHERVRSRLEGGEYDDVGDYLRDLIRRDQADRQERDALISALVAGEDSGLSGRDAPAVLSDLRKELRGDAA